jgi:hypothetical protein
MQSLICHAPTRNLEFRTCPEYIDLPSCPYA